MKKYLFIAFIATATLCTLNANGQDLRNSNNATIGKIDSDGTVRNSNNASIGKIDSDGTVRNSNNASIGKAKDVKREYAAAYFFFDYFK